MKLLSLMLAILTLLPCAAHADDPVTLRLIENAWLNDDILNAYTAKTGVQFERLDGHAMTEMANAFATRNDQIDLFTFTAYSGLYSVKEHDYYAPLEGSEILSARLNDLYPAVRDVLTDDGHMAGWVLNLSPMYMNANTRLLEENGLTEPTTFADMLDVCNALLEADALDSETSMFSTCSYTADSMMALFMSQYIMACGLEGGLVDFTRPEFLSVAERIRDTVPREEAYKDEAYSSAFDYPCAASSISADLMRPALQLIEGQSPAVEAYMGVATVNPYSARRDEAIAFLEFYASQTSAESYFYDASLTEPVKNDRQAKLLQDIAVRLRTLEAIEDPTAEQRDELEALRQDQANAEQYLWLITEEDIAFYRDFAQNLSIAEAAPVQYDESLRASAGLFLSGVYDSAAFAKACQDHINMIYQEHGIAVK